MAELTSTSKNKQAGVGKQRASKSREEILEDNRKILDYIRRHPQSSVAKIGKPFGLARDTTQKRINKLTQLGVLQRRYEVDLDAIDFRNRYRMDINVNPKDLRNNQGTLPHPKIKNLQQRLAYRLMALNVKYEDIIIEDVAVLMGDPADLCVTLRTRGLDQRAVFEFVTGVVRMIPGIEKTSTCIEAWSISRERIAQEAEQATKAALRKKKAKAQKSAKDTDHPAMTQNTTPQAAAQQD